MLRFSLEKLRKGRVSSFARERQSLSSLCRCFIFASPPFSSSGSTDVILENSRGREARSRDSIRYIVSLLSFALVSGARFLARELSLVHASVPRIAFRVERNFDCDELPLPPAFIHVPDTRYDMYVRKASLRRNYRATGLRGANSPRTNRDVGSPPCLSGVVFAGISTHGRIYKNVLLARVDGVRAPPLLKHSAKAPF